MLDQADQRFNAELEHRLHYLQAYCRKLTGSSWDAEDLLQETLMKFYMSLCKWEERKVTKSYLCRIAHNTWIDYCRRKQLMCEPLDEYQIGQKQAVDSFEVREALELLANQLPVRQAVVFLLMDVFHFTAKETATRIYATEGAVQAALHRAREHLRSMASNIITRPHIPDNLVEGSSNVLKAFLIAFQDGDPEAIFKAYNTLIAKGITINKVERTETSLYFYFRDPDGNLLKVTSY
jgi:RNA polymerase sigma factor (sigma-70 family)